MTVHQWVAKKRYVNVVLIALAGVFGVAALADAVGYGIRVVRLPEVLATAEEKTQPDEKAIEQQLSQFRSQADALKRRNMFAPPPQKPKQPVCLGIFGDLAIFDNKPYTVGEEVSGAKILEIGPTAVAIEWEGQRVELQPFAVDNMTDQQRRGSSNNRGSRGDDRASGRVGSDRRPAGGPPQGRFGLQPSPEIMDRMREMRERFMNASPEERERMRDEFRRRMEEGGGTPGGMPGGMPGGGGFRGRGR